MARTRKVREAWTARIYRLGEEPPDDLGATMSAEQRFDLVAELSRRVWELSGTPVPDYPRSRIPCRVIPLE